MLKYWFFLIILFPLLIVSQSYSDKKIDHVFIIDISGSMEGKPVGSDNVNIFPEVKNSLFNYIDGISAADNLFIFPFHAGIQDTFKITLNRRTDYEKSKEYIQNLSADGHSTYIYQSVLNVLKYFSRPNRNSNRIQMIYLFTDGEDNSPDNITFEDIQEEFELSRENNDFMYLTYFYFGIKSPNYDTLVEGINISELPSGEVPSILSIKISPQILNFGNFLLTQSNKRKLLLDYNEKLAREKLISISMRATFPELESIPVKINPSQFVITDKEQQIEIELLNFDQELIRQNEYQGYISFETADEFTQIIPEKINAVIYFSEEAIIEILPDKQEDLTFNFGELELEDSKFRKATSFRVKFNQAALKKDVFLTLDLKPVGDNPEILELGKELFFLDKNGNRQRSIILPATREITEINLGLEVDEDMETGDYQTELVISSNYKNSKIISELEDERKDTVFVSVSKEVKFNIPMIIPWWYYLIGFLILILLVVIVYCLFLAPKFSIEWTIAHKDEKYVLSKYNKLCGLPTSVGGGKADIKFFELTDKLFLIKPISKEKVSIKVIGDKEIFINDISSTINDGWIDLFSLQENSIKYEDVLLKIKNEGNEFSNSFQIN